MKCIVKDHSVNLSTGQRTDLIVGDGQIVALRQLSAEELACVRSFERAMREEVIPEIVRVMRRRAELADENRHRIIL